MNQAQSFYEQSLRRYPQAVDYLKGRGLTGQVAKRFGLGFAPPGYQGLATVFDDYEGSPDLPDCGLVIDSEPEGNQKSRRYDRFRDRVMFPIRNVRGDIIGFGGRVLGQGEPKYLNSPETPLFSKGQELYGLFEARAAIRARGYALVTEGYMDVVALAQWGFENAVATLGTAVTPQHVQRLFRQTDRVVFSFDGDTAGRKAAWRALEASLQYAGETRRIEFLFLPPEHDPDSYIREMGAEAFETAVQGALPLSACLLQEMARRNPLDQVEGRAAAIAMIRPMLQQVPAGAYRVGLLRSLAEPLQCTPAELEQQTGLRRKDGNGMQYTPGKSRGVGGGMRAPATRAGFVSPEHRLAALLLAAPQYADRCGDLGVCYQASVASLPQARHTLSVLLATVCALPLQARSHAAALVERFRDTVHEQWVNKVWLDASGLDEKLDFETEIQSLMYQCLDGWLNDEISAVVSAGLATDELKAYYRLLNEKRQDLKNNRLFKV
jgi:DNA primase